MKIYVDADSCPIQVREIISRAAKKRQIESIFVANRKIPLSNNSMTKMIVVENGEGVADKFIVDNAEKGDIVITRDIPLAADLVPLEITVINDRGQQFTKENIRERLSVRDIMKDFRELGISKEKHSPLNLKDVQRFAAAFDSEITRLLKKA